MSSKRYLLTCLLICSLAINACSQTPAHTLSDTIVFQGSTPGDEPIKSLLTIPDDSKVDFIRWKLTLDPITSNQHTFSLDLVFGEVQQNTLGFKGGGEKLFFTGEYTVSVNNDTNFTGEIYHLKSGQFPVEILLRKVNDNLLHLLSTQNVLMVGNAGWSYTLNRINPVIASSAEFTSQATISLPRGNISDTTSVFHGRTVCDPALMELNGISAAGYQRIKWGLKLYKDPVTLMPATFQLRSIYVGIADTVYTRVGRWETTRGMKNDSKAIVYLLKLNEDKTGKNLAFLRGDDNILFFLDKDRNLMVGNGNHSYTLNRIPK